MHLQALCRRTKSQRSVCCAALSLTLLVTAMALLLPPTMCFYQQHVPGANQGTTLLHSA